MNASATQPKAGDKVIYVGNYGARPKTTNIDKVTPKGWLRVFVPAGGGIGKTVTVKPFCQGRYDETGSHGKAQVHLFTEEKLAELNADADRCEQRIKEKQEEHDRQRAERDARLAAETAKVKELCENDLATVVHSKITLPNGDRLVTMFAPVNPQYADRKAGRNRYDNKDKPATGPFEVVICRLVTRNEKDWVTGSTEPRVECYMTYCNGGNQSFPSCSGDQQKDDESCLWEALRHCYYSW